MGAFQYGNMNLIHQHKEFSKDIYYKYSNIIDFNLNQEKSLNKDLKSSDVISALTSSNRQISFSDSIFIFDWDDTLMCTTFLTPNGTYDELDLKLTETQIENMKILDESAFKLLFSTIILGDTYVVTNATMSWVQYSAEKFYPKVNTLLKKIKILSARELYEKAFPMNNKRWKICTFLDIKKSYHGIKDINIICVGDSNLEMHAANALAAEFEKSYLKTIKFRESPKLEELIKQINLIVNNLKKIYEEKKNLTITVERKSKNIKDVSKVL